MGNSKPWLFVVAGILIGLAAGGALGRHFWPAPASPPPGDNAQDRASHFDASGHQTMFVTVEPGVQLEVLDWGGTGETLVFLAGLGDNAHVYDEFAHQFTDRFRVVGITRRGFGKSSQPAQGYDVATRARDDVAVLDHLKVPAAVFVGHSFAGDELSKLGADHPDRVRKLVYLDALEFGGEWPKLPQPPSPDYTDADLASMPRFAAANARFQGVRQPLAAVAHTVKTDAAGKITEGTTTPEITKKMKEGSQLADYSRIQAPVLGIFNILTPESRWAFYYYLTPAQQAEYERSLKLIAPWQAKAIQRFRSEIKNVQVVELHDSNHYIFIREESLVVRLVRKFLLEK